MYNLEIEIQRLTDFKIIPLVSFTVNIVNYVENRICRVTVGSWMVHWNAIFCTNLSTVKVYSSVHNIIGLMTNHV